MLGTFKYLGFFVDSAAQALHALGFQANLPVLQLVLPVGISFYTFQTLSYVLDVYHGVFEPEEDLLTFALFVAYFPHMVAGPIQRASNLLTKLSLVRTVDEKKIYSGAFLVLLGLVKKVAIADTLAPMVEQAFGHSATSSWFSLLMGAWQFSIQIYCDFAGYSDIARGVSRMMGIELMENFQQPYLSQDITEFWRRWHISLSTWLRDYLYIPLGGSRGGPARTYRNLMTTMVLGGLWHGANWTFVIWGFLHGLFLAAHKWMLGDGGSAQPRSTLRRVLAGLGTFHLVMLAWVFFRAPTFRVAFDYLGGIFTLRGGLGAVTAKDALVTAAFSAAVVALDLPQRLKKDHTALLSWPWAARAASLTAMLLLLLLLSENNDTPFIYFQF